MKTYSNSNLKDFISLFKHNIFTTTKKAKRGFRIYLKFSKEIKEMLNYKLENKKILDIGCGQRFPYTYLLSKNNNVIGIDLDVILLKHSIKNYKSIIKENGFNRFIKTFIRSIMFDRTYFKKLSKLNKIPRNHYFKIMKMNAEKLQFKDNSFDFIISINSFEHFGNVEQCVKEIKRVLKKGGHFYITIDFYTKIFGGHKYNPKNPWDHLLNPNFKPNVFLNKLKLDDYKTIFKKYFENVKFNLKENKFAKTLLTSEIRKKLSKYSESELVVDPLVAIGRK